MRKNATKLVAALLSAALVVTSVSLPGAKADAASKAKISDTTAKLYANGPSKKKTKTITVTVGGKQVAAKFTSTKASVATVGKTSGKITAKKAGSTVIKATYKGKTYNCKVTVKNYKYIKKIAARPTEVKVAVGEKITPLKVTTYPSNPTVKKWKFYSSNNAVASVGLNAGWIKGRTDGEATITVKATDGSKRYAKVKVIVGNGNNPVATEEPEETTTPVEEPTVAPDATMGPDPTLVAAKVEGKVVNPLSATRENTILTGQTGDLQFQVTDKDGKAVANERLTLTITTPAVYTATWDLDGDRVSNNYRLHDAVAGQVITVKTDDSGIARAALAPIKAMKNDRTDAVCSYTVTAVSSTDKSVKCALKVSVAAIQYAGVARVAKTNNADLAQGLEANNNGYTVADQVPTVLNEAGNWTQYVSTQQVSKTGTTDHELTFTSGAGLRYPATEGEEGTAKINEKDESFNWKSQEYNIYDNTQTITKPFDTTKVGLYDYATLHFNSIDISKYTKFTVSAYRAGAADLVIAEYGSRNAGEKVNAGDKQSELQISKDILNGYTGLRFTIESMGQVNKNQCAGVDVKDLTYVYTQNTAGLAGAVEGLSAVSINWEVDKEAYTVPQAITQADLNNANALLGIKAAGAITGVQIGADETAKFSVPSFPRVGVGIITIFNAKGEEIRYYAVPTVNEALAARVTTTNPTGQTNRNVLAGIAYVITRDEAKNSVGAITKTDGNTVTVNSEKTGTTFLKGTITAAEGSGIELDATNSTVYTSVQWNPIPNAAAAGAANSTAAIAIKGQTVQVKAQLYDTNDNLAARAGVRVTFNMTRNQPATAAAGTATAANVANTTDVWGWDENGNYPVHVISYDGVTDANGIATLTLRSDEVADLINVTASTTGDRYNVRVVIGTGDNAITAAKTDIYWVDLGLSYIDSVTYTNPAAAGNTFTTLDKTTLVDNNVTAVRPAGESYGVGESWKLGTIASVRGLFTHGIINPDTAAKRIGAASGIDITAKLGSNTGGTVETDSAKTGKNGMATVTSAKTAAGNIVFSINNAAVSANAEYTINGTTYKSIGTGNVTIPETLTIPYSFGTTVQSVKTHAPDGTIITGNNSKIAYVLAVDETGVAIPNARVKFTLQAGSAATLAVINATDTLNADGSVDAIAGADGIAKVTINEPAGRFEKVYLQAERYGNSFAAADKMNNVAMNVQMYEFKAATTALELIRSDLTNPASIFDITKTKTNNTDTITLTFSEDIIADSVNANEFRIDVVEDTITGAVKSYGGSNIKDVKVNGATVTITMKGNVFANMTANSTVNIAIGSVAATATDSVQHTFTSVNGKTFAGAPTILTAAAQEATILITNAVGVDTTVALNGVTQ